MPSLPYADWLALSEAALATYRQLAEIGRAGAQRAQAQLPADQAQLAISIKAALALDRQWQDLRDEAGASLLQSQVAAFQARRAALPLQELMALQQSLADDLAAQRQAALKAIAGRADACVEDLGKAGTKDEIGVVVACLFEDVGNTLRAHAKHTFTLLNSANAATTVLTHRALDAAIAAAAARAEPS